MEQTAQRWALVTGASRGIGRAIVELLLARGRNVVACGRDAAALQQLEQTYGERVRTLPTDLSQPGEAVATVERTLALVGALDELVYAAGIVHYAAIGGVEEEALRAQLELNFVAPFLMLQQAGLHMRARGRGAMVVIASTLAYRNAPSTSAYAASKAALVSAARSLALELAPEVRVNAVAPGVVDTDMIRVPRRPVASPEERARAIEHTLEQLRHFHPLKRLGQPGDVAEATLYLLDASWVTGSVLTVDGGLTAS
jgi:3-oxoacyl-[acyl-carrier protein] reductase